MGALPLLCIVWLGVAMSIKSTPKALRVGLNQSPPYSLIDPDGTPHGLRIGVVMEAARRRGVPIQWVLTERSQAEWPQLRGTAPFGSDAVYFSIVNPNN